MKPEEAIEVIKANMGQPEKCIHGYAETCCYPIDDCKNCPARPDSGDWYWGMTGCEIK